MDTRKAVLGICTQNWSSNTYYGRCIAKYRHGRELWTVWERTEHKSGEVVDRYISLFVLQYQNDTWGAKEYREEVHPYFYTCPVRFLELAPEVRNQAWRDLVVKHHKEMGRRRELVKQVKKGDVVRCIHVNPDRYLVLALSPMIGRAANGGVYRVPKTRVVEIVNQQGAN